MMRQIDTFLSSRTWLPLFIFAACASSTAAQTGGIQPHIGYIYPAGAQQGTTCRVLIGGQYLGGAKAVVISGEGVTASVLQHYRPLFVLQKEERAVVVKALKDQRDKQLAALRTGVESQDMEAALPLPKIRSKSKKAASKDEVDPNVRAPEAIHPGLYDLENKSLQDLRHLLYELFFPREKRQLNAQIGQSVLIEVKIDRRAEPGDRELRVRTRMGLSNPMIFQVGRLPETSELEPNDPGASRRLPPPAPLELPFLLNGQIFPGDVDRFQFRAEAGQELVIRAQARHLIPYLADAVPGWFQATLTLYDAGGREVGYADDYQFMPDPVLHCKVPENGVYEIEIRDALYRGRQDFVYRVSVSEEPFITGIYPLGGKAGRPAIAQMTGWNLRSDRLAIDTSPGVDTVRHTAYPSRRPVSNRVAYAVDSIPETREVEPNNTIEQAQKVRWPRMINGRIDQSGDVDIYQFKGKKNDEIVVNVIARRLHSPLDSLIRLTDTQGTILAWNDDHKDPSAGLLTHHADSYLKCRLPTDQWYCLQLLDAQHHGGESYSYRAAIAPPRPDFELRATPSSINIIGGGSGFVHVHALRKEGFDGEIRIRLSDAPNGFSLQGARIPRGCDRVPMTLTLPPRWRENVASIRLEGVATIDGEEIVRPVTPAEDMMQAFIYQHLVPVQKLMVAVRGGRRRAPRIDYENSLPLKIAAGTTTDVRIRVPRGPRLHQLQFNLIEPPPGFAVEHVSRTDGAIVLKLAAGRDSDTAETAGNLIVGVTLDRPPRKDAGKQRSKPVFVGVLPAIPYEMQSTR